MLTYKIWDINIPILKILYNQYFFDTIMTIIAIYILTIVIIFVLSIKTFMMAVKLIVVKNFIAFKTIMASIVNTIFKVFIRVMIIIIIVAI